MIRTLLIENFWWKVLSLGLATMLWFAFVDEPELVTSHSAPILYKNLPRDLEIGADVPEGVHLELRGPAGHLSPAALQELAVTLDLSGVQSPGERTFTVSGGTMQLPPDVALLRAVPSELRLRFDRLLSRDVPVQIRFAGPPADGYFVEKQEVKPDRLRIIGPENRVAAMGSAQTDAIDIGHVVGEMQFRVHAYLSDPQVRFEASPVVSVRITVRKIQD